MAAQDIKIPRPAGARTSPGVGKIYIKFDTTESAQKALAALAGRKFADRTVVVTYFSEVCHLSRDEQYARTDIICRNISMSTLGKESW